MSLLPWLHLTFIQHSGALKHLKPLGLLGLVLGLHAMTPWPAIYDTVTFGQILSLCTVTVWPTAVHLRCSHNGPEQLMYLIRI